MISNHTDYENVASVQSHTVLEYDSCENSCNFTSQLVMKTVKKFTCLTFNEACLLSSIFLRGEKSQKAKFFSHLLVSGRKLWMRRPADSLEFAPERQVGAMMFRVGAACRLSGRRPISSVGVKIATAAPIQPLIWDCGAICRPTFESGVPSFI